jgi:hypothetical protein
VDDNLFWQLLPWWVAIAWLAWWLWAVNWQKAWPVLATGGWVPVVLLVIVGALAWSQIAPSQCTCLGIVTLPNFWWQLGGASALAASALFCGWLQGVLGMTPEDISVDPPAHVEHGHH